MPPPTPAGSFGPSPGAAAVRLALVRHGEPDESMRGRCCGSLDPSLSPLGRHQLERVGDMLRGLLATVVYTSPLRRAVDSAHSMGLPVPVSVDPRLREIDFGALEGLTHQEIADRYPDVWEGWMREPTGVTFPGGEPFGDFCRRVDTALIDLAARHRGEAIVIVAHGGVNRRILSHALGMEPRHMFRLQQSCGAVSIVDIYEDGVVLQVMNVLPGAAVSC